MEGMNVLLHLVHKGYQSACMSAGKCWLSA